jgi:predicted small lipoprotein YifL
VEFPAVVDILHGSQSNGGKSMIRLLSVAVVALALSLAGCGSSGNVEAPKAPAGAAKPAAAGCSCGDKPQGSRTDCACKDKAKAESPACKSCDKAGTGACPATGATTGETKTPEAEKK